MPDPQLTFRDKHAAHRSSLANQRTFLAWMRTALAFGAAGISLMQLFKHPGLQGLGGLFVATSIGCFVFGIHSFLANRRRRFQRDA